MLGYWALSLFYRPFLLNKNEKQKGIGDDMPCDTVIYHSPVNHYTSMFVSVRVLLTDIVESGAISYLSSFLFINVFV